MKQIWIIIGIVFLLIMLKIYSPFSLVQVANKYSISGFNAQGACEQWVNEYKQDISYKTGITFPIAACLECPKSNYITQGKCDLNCGQPCPAGYICGYPPPNFCAGQCVGGLCPGDQWHEQPGCRSETIDPSYLAYVIQDNEVGTQIEQNAQNKALDLCGNIQIPVVQGSTTPGTYETVPPSDPPVTPPPSPDPVPGPQPTPQPPWYQIIIDLINSIIAFIRGLFS